MKKDRLIAEFMELTVHPNGMCDDPTKGVASPSFGIKYCESWDWLMPVGKKIFDWLQEEIKTRPPHTASRGDLIECDISCAIREYDIEKAYEQVVRFIEWYNLQKQ